MMDRMIALLVGRKNFMGRYLTCLEGSWFEGRAASPKGLSMVDKTIFSGSESLWKERQVSGLALACLAWVLVLIARWSSSLHPLPKKMNGKDTFEYGSIPFNKAFPMLPDGQPTHFVFRSALISLQDTGSLSKRPAYVGMRPRSIHSLHSMLRKCKRLSVCSSFYAWNDPFHSSSSFFY